MLRRQLHGLESCWFVGLPNFRGEHFDFGLYDWFPFEFRVGEKLVAAVMLLEDNPEVQ